MSKGPSKITLPDGWAWRINRGNKRWCTDASRVLLVSMELYRGNWQPPLISVQAVMFAEPHIIEELAVRIGEALRVADAMKREVDAEKHTPPAPGAAERKG